MSREMKLTPTFSFRPPLPNPHSAKQAFPWQGGRKYNVNCGHGVTSASVSLYFHPLVFAVIHCSLALSVWSTAFALPVSLHTHTQTHMHSQTFFTFICLFSCFSPLSLFFSPAVVETWMYWHVSFHQPTVCEWDRGECTDLGECVLRRKGPSQP